MVSESLTSNDTNVRACKISDINDIDVYFYFADSVLRDYAVRTYFKFEITT